MHPGVTSPPPHAHPATSNPISTESVPLAPDFTLPRHDRPPHDSFSLHSTLHDRGPAAGPVLLVFFRGHWCPYCRRYLSKLRDNFTRFEQLDTLLLAISPETPATSANLANELQLPFPLLSDTEGQTIDAYGVRNRLTNDGPLARSRTVLPHPAVFVINPQGQITFRSIDRNYKKRTTIRTLFQAIQSTRAGLPFTPDQAPVTD